MTEPVVLFTSDQHCHSWSAFSHITPEGLNSRLAATLHEMQLAHKALRDRGGNVSVMAGDLFHVRGKIEPSVFNPTHSAIEAIHAAHPHLVTFAIPGNHDLEGKHSTKIGNAMQKLESIPGFTVAIEPVLYTVAPGWAIMVVPWEPDLNKLREWANALGFTPDERAKIDLVLHAPVNGVIQGIPDHHLEPAELVALGFKRVFVGHYHNHKVMEDGKVISIGATSHQTWCDVGSKAGFLLVYKDSIEHIESSAPKFVDLTAHEIADEFELMSLVSGNYVRLKIDDATDEDINRWRADLKAAGALDANIIVSSKKSKAVSRTGTTVSASTTLEASVAEYVEKNLKPKYETETQKLCAELIAKAREAE